MRWSDGIAERTRAWGAGFFRTLAVPALLAVAMSGVTRAEDPPNAAASRESASRSAARVLERAVVEAIAKAEASVVAIARFRTDGPNDMLNAQLSPRSLGTGGIPTFGPDQHVPAEMAAAVVIDRQGHLLTNYHVLGDPRRNRYVVLVGQGANEMVQVLDVDQVRAGDPWTDLAVLQVDGGDWEPITWGDAREVRKGQFVISLGNPYQIARDGQVSASWGMVSHLSRAIPRDEGHSDPPPAREMLYDYGGLIQTDARLNMGTSGGPLINLDGEMIGLTTALATLEGFEDSMGFAIPVDESFRRTVDSLQAGRQPEFGFLGVAPRDLSQTLQQQGRQGVLVAHVVPATPAAAANIRKDDILTRLNHLTLRDSQMLMCELGKMAPGETVELTLERGAQRGERGREVRTTAVLSKRHIPSARRAFAQQEDPRWRGLTIDYATAVLPPDQLQPALESGAPASTLAVRDVHPESPAWAAGMRPGALVTHVEDRRVATPEEFHEAVASLDGEVQLRLATDDPRTLTISD